MNCNIKVLVIPVKNKIKDHEMYKIQPYNHSVRFIITRGIATTARGSDGFVVAIVVDVVVFQAFRASFE